MCDLFGNGIFNANGAEWKYQRKTASHIFNVKNFRDHFTECVLLLYREEEKKTNDFYLSI